MRSGGHTPAVSMESGVLEGKGEGGNFR
jgi:hypothetical protein